MDYTIFMILAPLAAAVSVVVAVYAWRYRKTPGAPALAWYMLMISGWLISNALELTARTPTLTLFWAKLTYIFIASSPVNWLIFALTYTNKRRWLSPFRLALFYVIPFVTIWLAETNEFHSLIWESYGFFPVGRLLAMRVTSYGAWFWVNAVYSYALAFLGAFLISSEHFKSYKLYRRQSIWLIIGAITPLIANAAYIFRLIPAIRKDFSSVSFALAGMAFALGMFRYRLFDLKPVARDTLIDRMVDGMLVLDAHSRVVDLNPAAQAIIGVSGDAIIGKSVMEAFTAWPELVEGISRADDMQADIAVEQDGKRHHYDMRMSPLSDRRGRPTGRLIVWRDITKRQEAEEALHQTNLELQARNEELDTFGRTVAHDLKAPLSIIIGYATLLLEDYENLPAKEVRRAAQTIEQVGMKMDSIIEELMLLAGLRNVQVVMAPLDMAGIVAEATQRLGRMIEASGAEIITPPGWPTTLGHGPWVEEVWVNYLSNAIKYGGRPPRIELGATMEPDGTVRFWVHDNGSGLTPEAEKRLFVPFERLDQTRATGYGLGLSIVRRIVEKMGGQASVKSGGGSGQGSIFSFTLPAA